MAKKKEKDVDDGGTSGKWMVDLVEGNKAYGKDKLDHKIKCHEEKNA